MKKLFGTDGIRGVANRELTPELALRIGRIIASLPVSYTHLDVYKRQVQANSVAAVLKTAFGVTPLHTGILLALLVALVILGGIRRIGKITEKLVPLMALLYIGGSLVVLILGYRNIGPALVEIVGSAFTGRAAAGGFAGTGVLQSIRYGITRGVFSNEAGLGLSLIHI